MSQNPGNNYKCNNIDLNNNGQKAKENSRLINREQTKELIG